MKVMRYYKIARIICCKILANNKGKDKFSTIIEVCIESVGNCTTLWEIINVNMMLP